MRDRRMNLEPQSVLYFPLSFSSSTDKFLLASPPNPQSSTHCSLLSQNLLTLTLALLGLPSPSSLSLPFPLPSEGLWLSYVTQKLSVPLGKAQRLWLLRAESRRQSYPKCRGFAQVVLFVWFLTSIGRRILNVSGY